MHYLLSWVALPFLVSAALFILGRRLGGLRRVKAVGQYPYWAAAVALSWGWVITLLLGIPDLMGLLWYFPLGVIGMSGLAAGIIYANRKRWRWAAAVPTAAVLVCLLLAFGSACYFIRQPEMPTGAHFSVLTYNINWGGPRPDLAADAILDADADIVCLQETTPAWEQFLQPRLKEKYSHQLFRHYRGAGGMAVFSKRPVKEGAYVGSKAGWFPGWVLHAETPVGAVQILCVHLKPPLSERGSVSLGAYFSTSSTHLEEIKDFHPHLGKGLPTVVLGDFNEGASGSAVGWLGEKEMTDALPEFDPHTPTWSWRTKLGPVQGQFDHILYSQGLYCLSARVLKEGASDHYPVVAVFVRKAGGEDPPQKGEEPEEGATPLRKE